MPEKVECRKSTDHNAKLGQEKSCPSWRGLNMKEKKTPNVIICLMVFVSMASSANASEQQNVDLRATTFFNSNILDRSLISLIDGASLNRMPSAQTTATSYLDVFDGRTIRYLKPSVLKLESIKVAPRSAIRSTPDATSAGRRRIIAPNLRSYLQLRTDSRDQFGSPSGAFIWYTSSNTSVATVGSNGAYGGVVTAVAPGTTKITSYNGALRDFMTIIVEGRPLGANVIDA